MKTANKWYQLKNFKVFLTDILMDEDRVLLQLHKLPPTMD